MSVPGGNSSAPMSAPGGNSSAPKSAPGEKSSAPGGKSSSPFSLAVNSATNQIDQILPSIRIFGCELRYQSNSSEVQKSPGENSWAPGAVGKSSAPLSSAPALRAGIFYPISQVQDPSRQVGKSTQGGVLGLSAASSKDVAKPQKNEGSRKRHQVSKTNSSTADKVKHRNSSVDGRSVDQLRARYKKLRARLPNDLLDGNALEVGVAIRRIGKKIVKLVKKVARIGKVGGGSPAKQKGISDLFPINDANAGPDRNSKALKNFNVDQHKGRKSNHSWGARETMTLLKVVCGVCLRHGRLKNWPSIKRQMKSDRSEHTIRLKFQSLAEEAMKPLEKRTRTVRLPNQEQWDKLAVAMYYIYGNGSKTIQALEDLDDALQVIIAAGKDYMNAIAQGEISFTSEEEIGSHDSSLNKSGNVESSKDIEPPGQSREATKAERAKRLMTPLGKASGAPLFQGIVIHPAPLGGRQSPLQASEEDTISDDGVDYSLHEVSSKEDTETPIQYQERGVGCSSTLDGRELALQASAADTSSVLLASSDSEVVSWTVEELSSLINCIDIWYPNWSQVKAYMNTERSPQCIEHAWKELVESEKLQNPGADWEFHGLKLGSALLNKMITARETVTMLEAAAGRR